MLAYHSKVLIIHTSDWQIGMPALDMPPEARARFRQARIDAVDRILGLAEERRAAAVLVAGDLFDSNFLGPDQVQRTLRVIANHDVSVIALPGNHDSLEPGAILARSELPHNLRVLVEPGITEPIAGLQVVAAPWGSRIPAQNPAVAALARLQAAGPRPTGVVRVLAAHGQWRSYGTQAQHTPLPTERILAALEAGLIDYVALGDRHSLELLAGGHVAYSGTPEVTADDEEDPGWVLVVDLEPGQPPHIEPVRIGRWRRLQLDRELTRPADLDALVAELEALERPAETLVRLRLRGGLGLASVLEARERLEHAGSALAGLAIDDTQLAMLPEGNDPTALGLHGAAAEAYARLAEENSPTSRDALALLARLVRAEPRR